MLSFEGVAPDHALRLRTLVDMGFSVTMERPLGEEGRLCLIEGQARRVSGRGATADAAALDALTQWDEPAR